MADSSGAHRHPFDEDNNARLNLTGTELQAMLDTAIKKVVDRVLKDHKRRCDNTPNKDFKKGRVGSNQSKPNEAKPKCKTCGKQHFGKCFREQNIGCGICMETDHKTHECKNLKDATCYGCGEKGHIKTRCQKKATKGKGTLDSQAKPCGICNKEGHKTLECQDIKDATCYGYNEIGYIKTNCPNKTKKPEEAKKRNA
ncbi:cellular nucleic acid-binding protein homolog [Helianthus annuus]|uniref:cellular nucleic acid-binding protein homolog n=1 Tax=Helianthus annuus TaxID=4232 RepID=UPI000B8F83D4|nr:cellular nucleic acid-binding protein homolog [Helianthus annuus]